MEEKKKEFWKWVKAHKKQLILAGIGISAIAAILLGLKHKDALDELWRSLEKTVNSNSKAKSEIIVAPEVSNISVDTANIPRTYSLPQEPIEVKQHLRVLTGGRQHSAAKAAEAEALGIDLPLNMTIVDNYTKYAA